MGMALQSPGKQATPFNSTKIYIAWERKKELNIEISSLMKRLCGIYLGWFKKRVTCTSAGGQTTGGLLAALLSIQNMEDTAA